MNNEWTTDKPKESGWFWAYEALDPCDADVTIVRIPTFMLLESEWKKVVYAWGQWFPLSHFSHWIGPLEIPSPPEVSNG